MKQSLLDTIAFAETGMQKEERQKTGGFYDPISDAFGKMGQNLITAAKVRNQEKKSQNRKVEGYISQLESNVDLTKLSGDMQAPINEYLMGLKNEYANAAMNIVNFDAGSPEYMRYISTMNNVNNKVRNLAGQVKLFGERKANFINDFENGAISEGNDLGDYRTLSNIYTDDTFTAVDEGGNLLFSGADGKFKKFNEIPEYYGKDFDSANKIMKMMDDVYSTGQTLAPSQENLIRMQLNTMIQQGGRGTLLSLATDNFFNDGGLGIIDPRYYEESNENLLKDKVIESYVQAIKDSAKDGAARAAKNNKATGGRTTVAQQKLQQMQGLVLNNQDLITDSINSLIPVITAGELGFDQLYDLGTNLGLDVNNVTNEDGDIIGYRFEHPLVKQKVEISVKGASDPFLIQKALIRALGSDYLGLNITRPEPEQQPEETESDLPIIE